MAHAFDTGLALPLRTLIRNGTIALLAGLKRTAGGYLNVVGKCGAIVRSSADGDGAQFLYEAFGRQGPAIGVAVGESSNTPKGIGGFGSTEEYEILLYHVSNNKRDLTFGRLENAEAVDTQDPGLDVMLAHAKELVIGQRCGIDSPVMKQVRFDREDELLARSDSTIWLQTFRVTTALTIKEYRGVTQLLESLHVRTTQEDGEALLPEDATKETTVDAYNDDLEP